MRRNAQQQEWSGLKPRKQNLILAFLTRRDTTLTVHSIQVGVIPEHNGFDKVFQKSSAEGNR